MPKKVDDATICTNIMDWIDDMMSGNPNSQGLILPQFFSLNLVTSTVVNK